MLDDNRGGDICLAELVAFYHNIRPRLKYNKICNIICKIHGRTLNTKNLQEIYRIQELTRKCQVYEDILRELIVNELSLMVKLVNLIVNARVYQYENIT